jgi:hypothetical protein
MKYFDFLDFYFTDKLNRNYKNLFDNVLIFKKYIFYINCQIFRD